MRAYDEMVDFIVRTAGAENLLAFHPSAATSRRVESLTQRHKDGTLRPAERSELDQFLKLEHVMRLAKAKVRNMAVQPK